MKPIELWLARRRKQLQQIPTLDAALLGEGSSRYAWYRLRYVLLRAVLRTLFRLAEVAVFASVFSIGLLGHLLVFRSLTLLTAALWWGALETLRTQVRELGDGGRWPEASRRIEQWLAASTMLALASLGGTLAWILWAPSPFEAFSVVDVYVLGCGIRLAADVIARTYHSGIYALRRVYRPIWTLLAVDVADIAVLGLLWVWLGPWALGLSLALVGLLRASLATVFTRRAYRGYRLLPTGFPHWFGALRRARWSIKQTLRYAAGNSVTQMDAILVMALLAAPSADTEGVILLASLLHVVAPLQSSSFSWSRLFYFDFKRLESWSSPLLLARFEAFLRRVAWFVPLPIGVITLGLMAAFWRGPAVSLAILLTILAALRAWISLYHLRAFSLSDHRYLLRLAAALGAVALVVYFLPKDPEVELSALGLMLLGLLLLLGPSRRELNARVRSGTLMGLSGWIAALFSSQAPVRLGVARADHRLISTQRLASALSPIIDNAPMARLGRDVLVWFETAPGATRRALVTAGGGTIRALELTPTAPSGPEALERGVADSAWERWVRPALRPLPNYPSGVDELFATLKTLSADVRIESLSAQKPLPCLEGWEPRQLRSLILQALRIDSNFRRGGPFEVAVLAPAGNPLALVILPAEALRFSSLPDSRTSPIPHSPSGADATLTEQHAAGASELEPEDPEPSDATLTEQHAAGGPVEQPTAHGASLSPTLIPSEPKAGGVQQPRSPRTIATAALRKAEIVLALREGSAHHSMATKA